MDTTASAARRFHRHARRLAFSVLLALTPFTAMHGQAADRAEGRLAEPAGAVRTVLTSRNTVWLGLMSKPASLTITIRSIATGRQLAGNASFELSYAGEVIAETDNLTCASSLSFGCGVVARFSTARRKAGTPSVYEAQVEDGVLWIEGGDHPDFEKFVAGIVDNTSLAVKVRVDQQQDFLFDVREVSWPLADFPASHPFAVRFARDPVLAALKQRFPARYLKIVNRARDLIADDAGSLEPEAETQILEAIHAAVGSLRPMVPDSTLERIVANAAAAARQVGDRDLGLCNALAVAARSPLTVPELKDTPVAREEYALWREVVEQAHPRFIRKVPNEDLLPSTPRFEENMRAANEAGCGMFAAVIEAILKLPREERRLWLRATVGTAEDLRAEAPPPPRR